MLLLGALGMWVCGAFVYLGAQSTSATNIGLIYAATPVGIAVGSRWLLHEPSSRAQRLAMALALLGVLFVVARGDWQTLSGVRFAAGDLWIVAAAIAWAAYSVLQQRWPSALGARQRLACISAGGVLVLLPFTALELALRPAPQFGLQAALLIVLAAVLPGFLSYQAYALMLRELGATRSGVVMYLSPVYAAFTAWYFIGEAPHWYHGVGAALILPSIHLATRPARPAAKPAPA
jgi:drug/metabolite transporter (DMT)-like permease